MLAHLQQQMADRPDFYSLQELIDANPPPQSVRKNAGLGDASRIQAHFRACLVEELMQETREAKFENTIAQDWAWGLLGFERPLNAVTLKAIKNEEQGVVSTSTSEVGGATSSALPKIRTAKEIEALKRFFILCINRLLKKVVREEESINWLFNLADDWRWEFERETQFGFAISSAINIVMPELNVYGKGEDIPYIHLMNLLYAFGQGVFGLKPLIAKNPEERFGAYLFSVVCFSGITNWELLKRIALLSLKKQSVDEPYSSLLLPRSQKVDVDKAYGKQIVAEGFGFYRWIPDPVSAKLLQQIHESKTLPKAGNNLFKDYLEPYFARLRQSLQEVEEGKKCKFHLGMVGRARDALEFFTGQRRLLQGSRAMQRRTLPAFLWHYLERDYITHDLFVRTLKRLDLIEVKSELSNRKDWELAPEVPEDSELDDDAQMQVFLVQEEREIEKKSGEQEKRRYQAGSDTRILWVSQCLEILEWYDSSGKTDIEKEGCKTQLLELLDASDLGDAAFIKTLTDWMRWMLDQSSSLSMHQIQTEVRIFLPIMIGNYGYFGDFVDLDAQERMEEFDALETESHYASSDRVILRSAWDRFHEFLIATGQIQANQFSGRGQEVDAEYISESEYQLMCFALYYKGASSNADSMAMRNICLLVLMLSYRLGLRRSEVALLATAHVSMFKQKLDMLSVQWWIYRRLKSESSKRTIPLLGLLSDREALWLELILVAREKDKWPSEDLLSLSNSELKKRIQFYRSIQLSAPVANRFLFIQDPQINLETSVENIIGQIHGAIRAVTAQDRQLRFHHLRHSCATNSLMLILANRLPHSQCFILDLMYANPLVNQRIHGMATEGMRVLDYSDPVVQANDFRERSMRIREYLLNDPRASISEVYAVSRLLGHSSPITTLKSYVHIVDLLLGAFLHERFISLPKNLRSVLHPYAPQYLDALIEQTRLDNTPLPITLLEIQKTGKAPSKEESLTLLDIVEKSKSEGLLLILELLRTYFANPEGNADRYFKKAAIAGISKPMAEQLIANFNQVIGIYNKAKKDRTTRILPLDFVGDDLAMFKMPQLKDQAVIWSKVLVAWYKKRPSKAYPLLIHYVGMSSRSKPNLIRLESVYTDMGNPINIDSSEVDVEPVNSSAELRRNRRNYQELMDLLGIRYELAGNTIRSKGKSKKPVDELLDQNGIWALLRKLLFLMTITITAIEHKG